MTWIVLYTIGFIAGLIIFGAAIDVKPRDIGDQTASAIVVGSLAAVWPILFVAGFFYATGITGIVIGKWLRAKST